MPRNRSKRPRSSVDSHASAKTSTISRFDLYVPLPKKSTATSGGKGETQIILRQIIERLASTGYTHIAIVHTVYGRPHDERDRASITLPLSLWSPEANATVGKQTTATAAIPTICESPSSKIHIFRRLHAVIENVSDVAYFSATNVGPSDSLLREYDMISLCPRNDAAFQAICSTPTLAQIITLDYTAGRGGVQLPYKLRSPDVLAAIQGSMVWEIPYAPAILDVDKRKALIKTCRDLQMAHLNVPKRNFRILFNSGDRIQNNRLDNDVGAMALRTPDDLINVLQTVCRFDAKTSRGAMSESGVFVLNQTQIKIRGKESGKTKVARVYYEDDVATPSPVKEAAEKYESQEVRPIRHEKTEQGDIDGDDLEEDGYINLT